MRPSRAWPLVLALIAFPHTEWIQDVADAPGIEGTLLEWPLHVDAGPALVALFDALVIMLVLGRPLDRAHWRPTAFTPPPPTRSSCWSSARGSPATSPARRAG
jgi:hypothetical protein